MRKSTLLKALLAGIASLILVCTATPALAQHGGGHGGGGGEVEVSTAEEAAVFTVVVPTAAASTVVGLMAVATMVEDIPTAAIAAGVLCMAEAAGTEG